jgi:uncharacterized protein YjbJ (UPF0337 family)
MGDRMDRVKGRAKDMKGAIKQDAGQASGRPGTEMRGTGDRVEGKAQNTMGRIKSAVKKATR